MNNNPGDSTTSSEPAPSEAPNDQDQLNQLEQVAPAEAEPDTVSVPVRTRSSTGPKPRAEAEPGPVVESTNLEGLEPSTPEPTNPVAPTVSPAFPTTPQTPHKKGRRILLVVLIVVLAIIVAGLAVYVFAFSKPNTKPVQKDQSMSSMNMDDMANMDHAKMLADDAKQLIADKYSADNPKLKLTRKDKDASPEYKPAGTEFYISDNIASNLSIDTAGNDALSKQIVSTIADYLTSQNLKSKTVNAWDEYQDNIVVCTTPVKTDKNFSEPFTISCANKSAYDASAASLQPFVNALRASKTAPAELRSDNLAISGPAIVKDSQIAGYHTAGFGLSTYPSHSIIGGLFYHKDTGDWQFFMTEQNPPQCSDYNTNDLKNAYAGEPCGSADGNITLTVQPASAVVTPNTQAQTTTPHAKTTQP